MGSTGGQARLLAMYIAAVAMLLAPASAIAKKKQREQPRLGPVVTATATGPVASIPATTSDAKATCPRGLQAVGGGFSAPFSSGGALVVTSSYRSARNSWSVSATLVMGAGAATAYAYCRRKALRVTDRRRTGTLASGPGQSLTLEADCPRRAVAISGGFQMTSGPGPGHLPIPETSIGGPLNGAPRSRDWVVVAQNSSTGAQAITAHAYCAAGIKAPIVRQDQGSATVPVLGSLTETSVCRRSPKKARKGKKRRKRPRRLLSAGGFHSPFAFGVLPVYAASRIVGSGVANTAVNGGSVTGPMTVQSQAVCF